MRLESALSRFWHEIMLNQLWNNHNIQTMKDISYNTSMYLDLIKYEDKPTVSSIADEVGVSKSAVTMKVNELVKLGMVRKVQCTEDRRIQYLEINDEISEEYELCDAPIETAVRRIKENYPEEKISAFCEILDVFSECLSERPSDEVLK